MAATTTPPEIVPCGARMQRASGATCWDWTDDSGARCVLLHISDDRGWLYSEQPAGCPPVLAYGRTAADALADLRQLIGSDPPYA